MKTTDWCGAVCPCCGRVCSREAGHTGSYHASVVTQGILGDIHIFKVGQDTTTCSASGPKAFTIDDILKAKALIDEQQRKNPFERIINEMGLSLYKGDILILPYAMKGELDQHLIDGRPASEFVHENVKFSTVTDKIIGIPGPDILFKWRVDDGFRGTTNATEETDGEPDPEA